MSNRALIISLVVLIVVGGGAYAISKKSQNEQVSNNQPLQQVTIAEFGEVFLYAPLYIAEAKGFFKEEGLDVKIVPTGGDDKTFAALLSNDAQFGVADPTFTVISGEKGQPGKVIAAILNGVPFWGVAKDGRVKEITQTSELGSYRVATFPAPSTAYALQKKMFESGNLKPNIKEAAFGSLLATLNAGEADIALELEPNVSTAVNNGDKIVYSLSKYYPDFAITGLTALPSYLDKNPETAQKVVNAFQKADNYLRSNPSECADLMIKRFPDVPREVAEKAIANMIESNVFPSDTVVTSKAWEAAIQLRKEAGDIKGEGAYIEYVTTQFSDNAKGAR